jgi:GT2 family glycosyltransferase/glycosyltransferase involved in cell wall biosynthesis
MHWQAGLWRLRHVRRRAAETIACRLLQLIIRVPLLRRFPRPLIARVEGALIASADDPMFDGDGYLLRNPDVAAAGVDPLSHYLRHGASEGRDPNSWLGEVRYRRQARLGPGDSVSALAHYLALGRRKGLGPRQEHRERNAISEPVQDDEQEESRAADALARLAKVAPDDHATGDELAEVDVIVPVYRGRAETLNCLASVLEAVNRTRFRLVVIDDAGPDRRLRADLALLARRGVIELVVQPRNSGFVAAVNAGMRLPSQRDVIWLNADTEVHGDWIDRLRRAAYSATDVATVTPLTNNGTICSYPRLNTDNCEPLEVEWAEIDRIAARVNAGRAVAAPTCVGFATYVRRDALQRIGLLDEAAFGRGYGEENDFSRRAVRLGLCNLIAGDVYVRHLGQTSFGDERAERVAAAMRVMEQRHPGYARAVSRFVADDPVAPLRRAIDIARLRRLHAGARRVVLVVSHSLGGGTRQHVEEEISRLTAGGAGVVLMSGGGAGPDSVRLSHPKALDLPSLDMVRLGGRGLVEVIGQLGITELRLHHLADFGADAARRFAWLTDALGLPFEFTVHDYLAVCPRINMADRSGMYCGEPSQSGCQSCLMRRRSGFGAPDIRRWRRDYGVLLAMARLVRVPDRDVAARLRRYFPRLSNIVVRPHERLHPAPWRRETKRRPGPPRIAVIGAIGPIKGFDVLLDLAVEAGARRSSNAAMALTVIGYTRNNAAAQAAGITVTGAYRNGEIQGLIEAADPDLILIPSIWPETYCYTLSHALASGRPVAGFDVGAVGTRLRDAVRPGGAGQAPRTVLPLTLARDPAGLLAALIRAAGVAVPESTGREMRAAIGA